jgi:hypothetical protein
MRRVAGVALFVLAVAAAATALTSSPAGNAPRAPATRLDGDPVAHREKTAAVPRPAAGPQRPADPARPRPAAAEGDEVRSSETSTRRVIHGSGNIVVVSGEVEAGTEGGGNHHSGRVVRNTGR